MQRFKVIVVILGFVREKNKKKAAYLVVGYCKITKKYYKFCKEFFLNDILVDFKGN
jgi:hypothetical protein